MNSVLSSNSGEATFPPRVMFANTSPSVAPCYFRASSLWSVPGPPAETPTTSSWRDIADPVNGVVIVNATAYVTRGFADASGARSIADLGKPGERRRREGARVGRSIDGLGAFCLTLVPVRPRRRGERRSLRTFLPACLSAHTLAFNPRPRRLSTPSDAFELHPDIRSYGPSTLSIAARISSAPRSASTRPPGTCTTTTSSSRARRRSRARARWGACTRSTYTF